MYAQGTKARATLGPHLDLPGRRLDPSAVKLPVHQVTMVLTNVLGLEKWHCNYKHRH